MEAASIAASGLGDGLLVPVTASEWIELMHFLPQLERSENSNPEEAISPEMFARCIHHIRNIGGLVKVHLVGVLQQAAVRRVIDAGSWTIPPGEEVMRIAMAPSLSCCVLPLHHLFLVALLVCRYDP